MTRRVSKEQHRTFKYFKPEDVNYTLKTLGIEIDKKKISNIIEKLPSTLFVGHLGISNISSGSTDDTKVILLNPKVLPPSSRHLLTLFQTNNNNNDNNNDNVNKDNILIDNNIIAEEISKVDNNNNNNNIIDEKDDIKMEDKERNNNNYNKDENKMRVEKKEKQNKKNNQMNKKNRKKISSEISSQQKDIEKLQQILQSLQTPFQLIEKEISLDYTSLSISEILEKLSIPKEAIATSFSTIGHIAHVNLKDKMLNYKYLIGEIILAKNKKLRTVVNKIGNIHTQFRTFDMEVIAGDEDFETISVEKGFKYKLDFRKVYWNSRLSTEHHLLVDSFLPSDVICFSFFPFFYLFILFYFI